MKNKYTLLTHIRPIEKRKVVREKLNKLLEVRKKQLKLIEELLINPIKKNIEIMNEVLKSREPIEKYYQDTDWLNKRMTSCLKGFK